MTCRVRIYKAVQLSTLQQVWMGYLGNLISVILSLHNFATKTELFNLEYSFCFVYSNSSYQPCSITCYLVVGVKASFRLEYSDDFLELWKQLINRTVSHLQQSLLEDQFLFVAECFLSDDDLLRLIVIFPAWWSPS